MSILQALDEKRRDNKNLTELAKLPQTLIMQMGQRDELSQEEIAVIISKKAQMIDDALKQKALAETGGGQLPSVMEQNMMKVAQAENSVPQQMAQAPQQMAQAPQLPEDVGIAQNPVPPMQLAGGGIVAFDEGGDVDVDPEDEYQDLLDQAQEDETNQNIFDLISEMGSSADVGIMSGENKNIKQDTRERAMDSSNLVDRLRAEIMQRESGGRRYDKEGNMLTSSKGALGEMQVMPATARDPGFGIKPARNNSPDELRRVGDEYANVLLNRYKDPKLAMIAYNMGPGATDQWLASGADIRRLPKETQGYIRGVSFAGGGEVKHFMLGDLVMDDFGNSRGADPRTQATFDEYNRTAAELEEEDKKGKNKAKPQSKEAQSYASEKAAREAKMKSASSAKAPAPAGIGGLRATSIPTLGLAAASSLYGGLTGPDQVKIPTAADANADGLTAEEIANAKRPALIYPRIRGKERYAVDLPVTRDQKSKPIVVDPAAAAAATAKKDVRKADDTETEKFFNQFQPAPATSTAPPAADTPQAKAEEETFNLMKYIQGRQARADKAAEKDVWQAGLAAGLGMLGGTSEYWSENVGKGGQMGVQQLANLQKLRASQDIASDKMMGSAYNAEMLNKLRKDQLTQGNSAKYANALNSVREERLKQTFEYLKRPEYMDLGMMQTYAERLSKNPNDKEAKAKYDSLVAKKQTLENKIKRELPDPDPSLYGVSGGSTNVIKLK